MPMIAAIASDAAEHKIAIIPNSFFNKYSVSVEPAKKCTCAANLYFSGLRASFSVMDLNG